MHFVEKKKSTLKKTQATKGNTLVPTYQKMEVFILLFFQEQYKVLISKPVADKKRQEKEKKWTI